MKENTVINLDFTKNDLPDKCANLIIADPPYYKVKGKFDFVWKTFDDYLEDVEKWAKECKRLLADNGTLFWYGHAKKIAYSQVILDKYFKLENSLVWEKVDCQTLKGVDLFRSFAPVTERILMYSNGEDKTGNEVIFEQFLKPKNPFSRYLKSEFDRAKVSRKEISKIFLSKNGNITGCVSNWLNGDNIITKEQYLIIKKYLNNKYLKKEYEEIKKEYEEIKKEYEEIKRPFNNFNKYTDILKFSQETHITKKYNHDTKKPETLTRVLIKTCSRKGDTLVVPFAGSGTECAMGARECLKVYGSDINNNYAEMSNKRIKAELLQPCLF